MKLTVLALSLTIAATTYGQQDRPKEEVEREKAFQEKAAKVGQDTAGTYGWTHSVVTGLNLTQVSFKDWVAGGENALSYTLWLKASSIQDMPKTTWSNTLKLAFGQTRLAQQGLRKTDDEIHFETLLIYKIGTHINPYASGTVRTQFADGFTYSESARTKVSKFFDPAYLTQSAGVAYKPVPEFTTRLGAALREVIASEFASTYSDDDATADKVEKLRIQGGLESVSDLVMPVAENIQFTSRLELFAPLKTLDKIIVRSDNILAAKVNKYVTVNFDVQFINDVSVSARTQIKQTFALGLSYSLL